MLLSNEDGNSSDSLTLLSTEDSVSSDRIIQLPKIATPVTG